MPTLDIIVGVYALHEKFPGENYFQGGPLIVIHYCDDNK